MLRGVIALSPTMQALMKIYSGVVIPIIVASLGLLTVAHGCPHELGPINGESRCVSMPKVSLEVQMVI